MMSELWDLYDEDRNPLHKTHPRGKRLPKGSYHLAVGIWTVSDDNRLLLTLRSPEKRDWPSYWENTAGSVLAGETTRQGAVRELREETGLRVSEDDLVFLGTERGRSTIGDCFVVRKSFSLSDIVFQKGETVDARLVTLSELDALIAEGLVAPPVARRLTEVRASLIAFMERSKKGISPL